MKRFFAPAVYLMLSVLASWIFSGGCTNYVSQAWNNREIIFPTDLRFFIANEPIDLPQGCFSYSIVNYIDSGGCKSCKLKFEEWNKLIQEFKSVCDDEFEVLTVVHTSDYDELDFILARTEYPHPIAVDVHDSFNTLNHLPKEEQYHSFLLDIDNRVLAIGNPVNNPKIRERYIRILSGDSVNEATGQSDAGQTISKSLGVVHPRDTVSAVFHIANRDTLTYTVQTIVPSCHCISADTSGKIISPGSELILTLTFIADSITGTFDRQVDIFYKERESPDRISVYGYINNTIFNQQNFLK